MFDEGIVVPLGLFLSLAFTIVGVARIISDGRTRRRLLGSGVTPELARAIVTPVRDDLGLFGALKWGLVLGAIGLALVLIQFLPYRSEEPIVLGLLLLFGAAGLLAYYVGARRMSGRSE